MHKELTHLREKTLSSAFQTPHSSIQDLTGKQVSMDVLRQESENSTHTCNRCQKGFLRYIPVYIMGGRRGYHPGR